MIIKSRYSAVVFMLLIFSVIVYWLLKEAPVAIKVIHEPVVRDVSYSEVSIGSYPIPITAHGKVEALDIRNISSEVTGLVKEVGRNVVRGGMVNKGDTLLILDEKPLALDVSIKQSDLDRALLALMETKAKAKVAKRGAKKEASEYALYVPQLKSANSRVEAAKVALQYAEFKLASSTIVSPITGKVIRLEVNVGEYVSAAQPLITIYGVELGEVRLALTDPQVQLLKLNKVDTNASVESTAYPIVYLTNPQNKGVTWKGRITRVEGVRDSSQMMFVIAEVPLISMVNNQNHHEILIPGTYVEVTILGDKVDRLTILPRHVVRAGDSVWHINQSNKLQSKSVGVVYKDKKYAYIASGLNDHDKVVTSQFNTLVEGSLVNPLNSFSSSTNTELVGKAL